MKIRTNNVFVISCVAVCLALGVGSAFGGDSDSDGQAAMASETESSAAGFTATGLTVHVDQTYCATLGVQCSGLPAEPAGPNNNSLVRLGIQVAVQAPVSGIPSGSFTVANPFLPAGGTSVERFSCANCFQDGGNGLYTIFVSPASGNNWKSGSYFVQVRVGPFVALVEIDIPF